VCLSLKVDTNILLLMIFSKISISLAIFIPPAVEYAGTPMSIKTISNILPLMDNLDKLRK
jgi:hypothetical protein